MNVLITLFQILKTKMMLQDKMLLQDELLIIVLQSNNVYDISCKYYKETLEEINEQFLNCLNDRPVSCDVICLHRPAKR